MFDNRKELIKKIEKIRKRPLITYVTSIRPNMGCPMAGDSIESIIEQLELIERDSKEIDFLIISNGGDPIASLRIISLLRERFEKVSVIVPYVAYSAATVLSLGADEIVMHPFSNLGPVDPQITVSHNNGQGQQERLKFSSEDLRNYIDFVKEDIGISDQRYLTESITPLLEDVGPLSIGSAKRGQQLSLTLSEKLLSLHINDANKCKSIAKALNSSYYHHGYAVGNKEAKDIGLPITNPTPELEKLLWTLWKDYSDEMKCEEPFDIVKTVMNNPDSKSFFSSIPFVDIPANLPREVAQQIYGKIIQQTTVKSQQTIKDKVMIAAIETSKKGKAVFNDINIAYWRNPDMSLGANLTVSGSGWINNEGGNDD